MPTVKKECLALKALNSGKYLPACLITHTGTEKRPISAAAAAAAVAAAEEDEEEDDVTNALYS